MEIDLNVTKVHIPQFDDYKVIIEDGTGAEYTVVFMGGVVGVGGVVPPSAN